MRRSSTREPEPSELCRESYHALANEKSSHVSIVGIETQVVRGEPSKRLQQPNGAAKKRVCAKIVAAFSGLF